MCSRCEELEIDNERLRNTVQCLILAQHRLLDSIGEWTYPKIPNN